VTDFDDSGIEIPPSLEEDLARARTMPRPGTSEAVFRGCKCPTVDNHYGKGFDGTPEFWVISASCGLHGQGLACLR